MFSAATRLIVLLIPICPFPRDISGEVGVGGTLTGCRCEGQHPQLVLTSGRGGCVCVSLFASARVCVRHSTCECTGERN